MDINSSTQLSQKYSSKIIIQHSGVNTVQLEHRQTILGTVQEVFSNNLFLASCPVGWNSWTVAIIQLWVTAISSINSQHQHQSSTKSHDSFFTVQEFFTNILFISDKTQNLYYNIPYAQKKHFPLSDYWTHSRC